MAHNLTQRADGTFEMAFLASNGQPWHISETHAQSVSADDAHNLEVWESAAGFDWSIRRAKVRYPVSQADANDPASWRAMDDRHVLVRSDNGNALGIVSADYRLVQPRDVMHFFADLIGAAGLTMDTAGTLHGGKRFWCMASVTDAEQVGHGDTIRNKLLVCTSCDGTMATEARWTSVRVVCDNTLGLARFKAPDVKVYHSAKFNPSEVKQRLGIAQAQDAFADAMTEFRRLADVQVDKARAIGMTAQLFNPDIVKLDTRKDKKEIERILATKPVQTVARSFINGTAHGAKLDGVDGTAWGWLNAVTEYIDHNARARSVGNRINSAWFGKGEETKQRALEMVTVLANGQQAVSTVYTDGSAGTSILDEVLAQPVAQL